MNFKFCNQNFEVLFDLEVEIAIPNYYFGFSKLIFKFRKLSIESKNGHFNFEHLYLSLKIDISILKFFI
jgi:hypothetical protein